MTKLRIAIRSIGGVAMMLKSFTPVKEQMAIEIIDRFGKMPEEVNNLLEVAYLKHMLKKCSIEKIESKKDGILISFYNNHFSNPDKLLEMIFSSSGKIKLQNHQVLFVKNLETNNQKLSFSIDIVNKLLNIKNVS